MNFFIRIDIAFVANKLNWFFADRAVLVYIHIMSTFSTRVISHDTWYVLFVLK